MNDCPDGTQKFVRNDHLLEVTDENEVVVQDVEIDDVVVEDVEIDEATVTPVTDIDDSGLGVNVDISDDDDNQEMACSEPLSSGTIENMKNLGIEKDYVDKEPYCTNSEDVTSQRMGSINTALNRKLANKRKILDDPSILSDLDSGRTITINFKIYVYTYKNDLILKAAYTITFDSFVVKIKKHKGVKCKTSN